MPSGSQILTLDSRLMDKRAEGSTFASTRTLLEHRIVLWDPTRILSGYDASTPYRGCACLTDNGTAQFSRDSQRRAREMRDYLALGRLLVVMVPAPFSFYVATGETENEGTAAKPRLRRIVTPRSVDSFIPGGATLTGASGTSFQAVGGTPFGAFWQAVGDQFNYVAIVEGAETPLLTIEGTDHVVSALTQVDSGQVLLLPQRYTFGPGDDFEEAVKDSDDVDELWEKEQERIDRETDGEFLDALFDLAAALTNSPGEDLPAWSERFLLPKEDKAIKAVEKASIKADSA